MQAAPYRPRPAGPERARATRTGQCWRLDHLPPDPPPPDEDDPPGHDRPQDDDPVHPVPDEARPGRDSAHRGIDGAFAS